MIPQTRIIFNSANDFWNPTRCKRYFFIIFNNKIIVPAKDAAYVRFSLSVILKYSHLYQGSEHFQYWYEACIDIHENEIR